MRSLGGTLIYPEGGSQTEAAATEENPEFAEGNGAMNVPQKSFSNFDGARAYPRVCFFPFLWGVGCGGGCRG